MNSSVFGSLRRDKTPENGWIPSPSFYMSSKTFKEKLALPLRSSFCVNRDDTYLTGDIEIRRHNGLYWKAYKTKSCVLLKTGRLFIYSGIDRGLSINLYELRCLSQQYREKSDNSVQEVKSRGDFVLVRGKERLGLCIKGSRSCVTAWRRGLVSAQQGIQLQSADDTDEITWSQSMVDPCASEEFLRSMADRTLRMNTSMPSLALAYSTLPSKKYSDVVSYLKAQSLGSQRGPLPGSQSFCGLLNNAPNKQAVSVSSTDTIDSVCEADGAATIGGKGIPLGRDASLPTESTSPPPRRSSTAVQFSDESSLVTGSSTANLVDSGFCSPIPPVDADVHHMKNVKSGCGNKGAPLTCLLDTDTELPANDLRTCADGVQMPNWQHRSRLAGIPLLTADILDLKSMMPKSTARDREENVKQIGY